MTERASTLIREQTFSAVRWTSASAIIRGVLQVVQLAVLARILEPEHFGLVAAVLVIITFGNLLADLGLNSAYVQAKTVTPEQRSSLFWLNAAMGGGISIIVAAASPPLAIVLGDERLAPLLAISSATFLISALGQQLRMDAEKQLAFKNVAIIEVTSSALGFVVALASAYLGHGAYSLVFGGLAVSTSNTTLNWLVLSKGWHPSLHCSIPEVRSFIQFGGAMVANAFVNQLAMSADLLLGGRLLGAAALGSYVVPRNLMLQVQFLINPIVTRVGFPLISAIQDDLERVRSVYGKTLRIVLAFNAPIYLALAMFADEIVPIVLGAKWEGSKEVVRVLALWGLVRCTFNPLGSLLFGVGRSGRALAWNIGQLLSLIAILLVGTQWGTIGLAYAMLVLNILLIMPSWRFLIYPVCQMHLRTFLCAISGPILVALCAMIPAFYLSSNLQQPLIRLCVAAFLFVPAYVALSAAFNREWMTAFVKLLGLPGIARS